MGRFDGSVVWITGGGSGLGEYMAYEFAQQGASVAVSGRRTDRLEQVVAGVEERGARGLAVPCDVTDEDAVIGAAKAVSDHFGKLDVCVANAGYSVGGRVEKLTFGEWQKQFAVNVAGCAVTAKAATPYLRKTEGRLALIGSVASMVHFAKAGPYQASKAAVAALGNTLSIELKPDRISVTTIHPGFVKSEINQVDNHGNRDPNRPDKRPPTLMWETDDAARVMVQAIHRRKRVYVFTGHGKFGFFMGQHFPGLVHWIAGQIPNNTKG